jgi:hypothetical protein
MQLNNAYILAKLALIKKEPELNFHFEDINFLNEQDSSFITTCAEKLGRSPKDFKNAIAQGEVTKQEFFAKLAL